MLNEEALNLEVLSGESVSDISNNNEGIVFFFVPIFTEVTSQIELKHLQEIYSEFKKVNWEMIITTIDSEELIKKYISYNNIQFPIYLFKQIGNSHNISGHVLVCNNNGCKMVSYINELHRPSQPKKKVSWWGRIRRRWL